VRRESRGKAWLRATAQRSVDARGLVSLVARLGAGGRGRGRERRTRLPLFVRRRRCRIDEDDQLTRLPAWRGCCVYAIQEQWHCSSSSL